MSNYYGFALTGKLEPERGRSMQRHTPSCCRPNACAPRPRCIWLDPAQGTCFVSNPQARTVRTYVCAAHVWGSEWVCAHYTWQRGVAPSVLHFFSCATEYQHLYSPLPNSWARHAGRETASSLAATHELADDSPESRRCGEGGSLVLGCAHEVVACCCGRMRGAGRS